MLSISTTAASISPIPFFFIKNSIIISYTLIVEAIFTGEFIIRIFSILSQKLPKVGSKTT